jgi:hypothetical protein
MAAVSKFKGLVSGLFVMPWGRFLLEKKIFDFPDQSNYGSLFHKNVKYRDFRTDICVTLHNPDI